MITLKDISPKDKIENISTVLLSVAALAITWCSYQSALWNGIQSFRMAESNISNRIAQQYSLMSAQQQEIDVFVALHFLDAVIEKKQDNIDYYLKRSKPGLATVMSEWLAMDPMHNDKAPPHPLATEQYRELRKASQAQSDSASASGQQLWQEARHANRTSDKYTFLTVIFSLVMFLCAISTKTSNAKAGYSFLALAGAIFFVTFIIIIFLMPVTTAVR